MLMDGCIGFKAEDLAGGVIRTASGMGKSLMVANTVGAATTKGIEDGVGGGGVGCTADAGAVRLLLALNC